MKEREYTHVDESGQPVRLVEGRIITLFADAVGDWFIEHSAEMATEAAKRSARAIRWGKFFAWINLFFASVEVVWILCADEAWKVFIYGLCGIGFAWCAPLTERKWRRHATQWLEIRELRLKQMNDARQMLDS